MANTGIGNMSFDTQAVDKAKDVRDTQMLEPGAKEPYATGKNEVSRDTRKHKPFGKLGAKGFC